jgi:TM2 domain-containing membrane protein YozV
MKEWYVQISGFTSGPLSASDLKKLVEKGKLTPETPIRKEGQETWSKAGKVKGLFGEKALITTKANEVIVEQPKQIIAKVVEPPNTKACPYCGEGILLNAVKCRFCNEYLDESKRPQSGSNYPAIQINNGTTAQPVHHTTVVHMHGNQEKWSRGTAAVLSFLIPGLGQLYKGQLFNGLLWFVVTIGGYVAFVIPGVLLHICCIFGAASGDNTK